MNRTGSGCFRASRTKRCAARWSITRRSCREVDDFLRALTAALEALDEPTVLVVYGDHMPSLEIEESELDSGNLYTTEYAVWANFPLEAEDKDVKAYQLASHVLEMLGINNGTLTKFHQMNAWSGAYETELRTLQYDMLYGDRVVYGGGKPVRGDGHALRHAGTWCCTARRSAAIR